MNELTQERSHINASSVKSALAVYQDASDMKEYHTQQTAFLEGYKRWHMRASIVASSSTSYQLSSNMNELTQERSHTNAGIVKNVSAN